MTIDQEKVAALVPQLADESDVDYASRVLRIVTVIVETSGRIGDQHLLARAKRAEDALASANAKLDAINSINESDWDDGTRAAVWVCKIMNDEPLDGMVTQEELEAKAVR